MAATTVNGAVIQFTEAKIELYEIIEVGITWVGSKVLGPSSISRTKAIFPCSLCLPCLETVSLPPKGSR